MNTTRSDGVSVEEYEVREEPFYAPVGDEVEVFEAAAQDRLPMLLKGPTGVGKTRFVEYMAWRLRNRFARQEGPDFRFPLVTVNCHEDLSASDLTGRFLIDAEGTKWVDGPLTRVVRGGGICYLDEVVEARKDTTVLIHPLTDHRRLLVVEKLGRVFQASPNFIMVVSYNPGYQSTIKDMKHSTRQRFVAIEFDFPSEEQEVAIIERETGVGKEHAVALAQLGRMVRGLKWQGQLEEGASPRTLIHAAKLIRQGLPPRRACEVTVGWGITDDEDVQRGLKEAINAIFPAD